MRTYGRTNALLSTIYFLAMTLLTLCSNITLADIRVFGPEKYTRETGAPQRIVKTFSVQDVHGDFTLVVQNGEGTRGRVSSAVIALNGVTVVNPDAFNKNVDVIRKAVTLQQMQNIRRLARGFPLRFSSGVILHIARVRVNRRGNRDDNRASTSASKRQFGYTFDHRSRVDSYSVKEN